MTAEFIIRSSGIMALLLGCYYIFLSNEKILKFNRFFLLGGLILALIIPLVTLPIIFHENLSRPTIDIGNPEVFITANKSGTNVLTIQNILYSVWLAGATIMLIRFSLSVFKILNLKSERKIEGKAKINIISEDLPAFSFWNTIYISKSHIKNGEVPAEIIAHERCHITQKHSADIIFIEILKIIFWFNPLLYFYKKAVIQNHEFLADDAVISKNYSLKDYSELILGSTSAQKILLASSFNYFNTKKRFIMMTTTASRFSTAKKLICLPAVAICFVLFSNKAEAQKVAKPLPPKKLQSMKKPVAPLKPEVAPAVPKKEIPAPPAEPEKIANTEIITEKDEIPVIAAAPIQEKITTPAEYPGGANAFRTEVAQAFDTTKLLKQNGILKTTVLITVDENGKVTNVTADGNNALFSEEAVRATKQITESKNWTPGTEDGKPVSSMYKMPITMTFQ